ncbi:MAG: hypothetical protein HYV47_01015 [Candidatus Nealsonbacteria bacterium]|nr:hypothetical protein [Candidatus Nealsonbacteria bacterium]
MTEKDLIKQLKELKAIKPGKDWVLLTKRQILPEEEIVGYSVSNIFHWKMAFAPVISLVVVIGLFGFASNTVPGDFLFPVKQVTETMEIGLSLTGEKSEVHLRLANKRLEELNGIAEANKVRSLSPTIKAFQDNITGALDGLSQMNSATLKGLVAETQKLEANKQKVESVLGVQIGGETEKLEKQLAGYLIADLENRTLDEQGQQLLAEAKESFEAGAYTLALEKLWFLSNK